LKFFFPGSRGAPIFFLAGPPQKTKFFRGGGPVGPKKKKKKKPTVVFFSPWAPQRRLFNGFFFPSWGPPGPGFFPRGPGARGLKKGGPQNPGCFAGGRGQRANGLEKGQGGQGVKVFKTPGGQGGIFFPPGFFFFRAQIFFKFFSQKQKGCFPPLDRGGKKKIGEKPFEGKKQKGAPV